MGEELSIITPLHTKTVREYLPRMNDDKVMCMQVAKRYDRDFFDGSRRTGYGGYVYDGRYEPVARALIERYNLEDDARILDVGCGKGFVLCEFQKLLPKATVTGFDISSYAVENAEENVRPYLTAGRAQDPFPYDDNQFDLVLSFTTLHNLRIYELEAALSEIERVGKNKFITMEGYRNEQELFNLECWVLTCESFFRPDEWTWLFERFGYTGDYEFIYFE